MSTIPDPVHLLTPSGNLRRRKVISRTFEVLTVLAAGLAVLVLLILVYYAAKQGISQLSFSFLFDELPSYTGEGGGIGPALVGTAMLIVIATIIALPTGVFTAIYLSEFAGPRTGAVMRSALDLMAGLPTIIAGVFIAGLLTDHFGQSAIAGGLALSIVEVPLIARATMEALARVPQTLREASDALGVAHWRSVVTVTVPAAANGILTATILAIARAAGETAPVLFTCSLYTQAYSFNPRHSVASVPLEIFTLMESGYTPAIEKAWGAAFVLMVVVLVVNIGARTWLRRGERKHGL